MWRFLETYLGKLDLWLYNHNIHRALALHLRGEVRRDGLVLKNACNRLEIQWRARDIHPWDRDLSFDTEESLFAEQTLADTEAAICRLFEALPQVDVIELSVLGRRPESAIMSGTIHRSALRAARRGLMSTGMRLMDLGVRYHLSGWEFQSLNSDNGWDPSPKTTPRKSHGQLVPFR